MERSHALWLSTLEPHGWERVVPRSVEPVPASLEQAAAPGAVPGLAPCPASALLPRAAVTGRKPGRQFRAGPQ